MPISYLHNYVHGIYNLMHLYRYVTRCVEADHFVGSDLLNHLYEGIYKIIGMLCYVTCYVITSF